MKDTLQTNSTIHAWEPEFKTCAAFRLQSARTEPGGPLKKSSSLCWWDSIELFISTKLFKNLKHHSSLLICRPCEKQREMERDPDNTPWLIVFLKVHGIITYDFEQNVEVSQPSYLSFVVVLLLKQSFVSIFTWYLHDVNSVVEKNMCFNVKQIITQRTPLRIPSRVWSFPWWLAGSRDIRGGDRVY